MHPEPSQHGMRSPLRSEFVQVFHIPSVLGICACAAILLAAVGEGRAAIGIGVGLFLFILNAFLLYRAGRSVVRAGSRGKGAALAGLSSFGRILLLAVALAFVARWDIPAFLSSSGSLLFCQGNLQVVSILRKGRARWTNT
jgi:hypothetical protein